MVKSNAERQLDWRVRKIRQGLKGKMVYIPDTPEANAELRQLEKKLQEKTEWIYSIS